MDDLPWDSAPASPAAPSPPPPPPPGLARASSHEAPQGASGLEQRLDGIERELAELRAFRDRVTERLAQLAERPEPVLSPGRPADAELATARAELARLQHELERSLRAPAAGGEPAPELVEARAKLATLAEQRAKAVADLEKVEGELQSLKLLYDQKVKRATVRVERDSLRSGNASLDEKITGIVTDNDRLTEELARVKREATTRIKQLTAQLEKLKVEHEAARTQRDNLLRELQSRDGGEAAVARELTLEEITASEVFKTMLGNVRRTSREEVTLLHDAVASLRNVKPDAYNTVLEVVAKRFKEANVENPLAMLPRA